jgi:hypothetical protein
VPLLFASAAFLSAFLLFCVQPMIAKMVLPQFGGAPAVWNTCMVCFQAALLAGYGYAHAASGRLGDRRSALLHLVLLALPFLALPITVPAVASGGGAPTLRLMGRLLVAAGLPIFVVATTAPLLQRWFAATGHRRASDPYFLYAASNAGSLIALAGYVMLVEPTLTLGDQSQLWAWGYGVLAILIITCAVVVRRVPASVPGPADPTAEGERIVAHEWARWIALAFVPSSLLLGVTTYLTTDLAPMPMLWAVPLMLYLLSFILAFANLPAWASRGCALALPPAIVLTIGLTALLRVRPMAAPHWASFAVHLATFFLAATACHAELARRRPRPDRLTAYYLMISLGGVLGGLFNSLVAPLVFTWTAEYPLGLAMAALLVPAAGARGAGGRVVRPLDLALPLLVAGMSYLVLRHWGDLWHARPPAFLPLVFLAACLLFVRRPLRLALGLAAVAVVITDCQDADRNVVLRERNFFGVMRVMENFPPGMETLVHGNVYHGMQRRSREVSERVMPLLYYHPSGPIGQVFRAYDNTTVTEHIGVIGLGVGALAAYGKPGREMAFFEIDPAVERIARDPVYFHHLEDSAAHWRVVLGDARMSIGREPDGAFGLIVLDAFNGDAIPVHLLTREALRLYLAKLADGGLIALHLSNDYLDFEPVVGSLARDAGLVGLDKNEDLRQIPPSELERGRMPAHWIVLARRQSDLARLATRPGWRPLAVPSGVSVWTDNYSDLFSHLRWR